MRESVALGLLEGATAMLSRPPATVRRLLSEAAAILRQSDSLDGTRRLVAQTLAELYQSDWERPWVRELFDTELIFEFGGKLWRAPYTVDRSDESAPVVTIGTAVEVEIAYTEVRPTPTQEAGRQEVAGQIVPLVERAVRDDGTIRVKLIQPGWGSSGYYPAEMLERDGPKVFTQGVKMYWNHPTLSEEAARPEGDLNALAAELVTDARWLPNDPSGPGLYADAKVFETYAPAVEDLAPHIGVSIRALGRAAPGQAEGQTGPIIEELVAAKSVDFVTVAGAGGEITQLFEAARHGARRPQPSQEDRSMADNERLQETERRLSQLEEQNRQLRERVVLSEAQRLASGRLAAVEGLHEATRARLVARLTAAAPLTEAGELDRPAFERQIDEAATAELAYLAEITQAGQVRGLGSTGQPATTSVEESQRRLDGALARLGVAATS